ncbi:MAG: methyltransferase domain-containing protein [Gemmatimonadaceae bacterium]|nr:methyltransferase domain-containing protein [Gloeobacterales cyanobacterium ES-bin-141]
MNSVNDPGYWETRYRNGQTRWDLGKPAPALVTLLDSSQAPEPGKVAVLGCGRGHDAVLFAEHGHTVVGFDFAADAIAESTRLALKLDVPVMFLQHDLFELPSSYAGHFDLVVEHTCFSAIEPGRRLEYVQVVRRILKPGGEFIAIFFAHERSGGPPYRTSKSELEQLFGPYFRTSRLEPVVESVPERQGEELFGRLVRCR